MTVLLHMVKFFYFKVTLIDSFYQVLAPRIKNKVDEWDPVTDTIPIETWLHPWHAIMGDRLLHTYATLRQKLAKGLKNWIPGDRR